MPINAQIRSSSAPAVSATYAPKEKPAAPSSFPGNCAAMKSTAALKSSRSPRPSSHVPRLRLDARMRPDRCVLPRKTRGHDTLERLLADHHQCRYFDAPEFVFDPSLDVARGQEMHTPRHTARVKHVAQNAHSSPARCGDSAPPGV